MSTPIGVSGFCFGAPAFLTPAFFPPVFLDFLFLAVRSPLPVLTRGSGDAGVAVQANLLSPFPAIDTLTPPGKQISSRMGDIVRSHPMAGTTPRGGDPTADARLAASLLASAKDRHEHQLTIDMVYDTLLPWCSYVDFETEAVMNAEDVAERSTALHLMSVS